MFPPQGVSLRPNQGMDALAVRRKLVSTCFLAGLGEDILGLLGLLQKLRVTLCRLGGFLYRSCRLQLPLLLGRQVCHGNDLVIPLGKLGVTS